MWLSVSIVTVSPSTPQICIAFAIHRGIVVIPKTVNPTRITENLKSTEVKLDPEDMKRLREADKNSRLLTVRHTISDTVEPPNEGHFGASQLSFVERGCLVPV